MLTIEEKIRAIEEEETDSSVSQEYVDSIIAKQYRDETVVFRKPLSGIIDLKRATALKFSSVHFQTKGKITRVVNIPKTVTDFACNAQLLMDIPAGLEDVEILSLDNNHIREVDLKKYKKLRVLSLKSNRLKSLKFIPDTIEELYLDNNSIRTLNLANLQRLRILHCENNSMMRIENVPSTIVDLQTERGNANLHIDYSFKLTEPKDASPGSSQKRPLPEIEAEYYDALNEYFRMKSNYEEELKKDRKLVRAIAVRKGMRPNQLRSRVASIVGKCVNCRRRVGTIFKQREMRYLAYCGDVTEPCPLKIELFRGDYANYSENINFYYKEVNSEREDIIQHKMDTLFGYVSENQSADAFKKMVTDYQVTNKIYEGILKDYSDIYFSDERKELVRLKQMKLYELERAMDDLMIEYEKTPSEQIMADFTTVMSKEYIPEKEQLRKIRYATMHMETLPKTGQEKLVQTPLDFTKIDKLLGEAPRILQMTK